MNKPSFRNVCIIIQYAFAFVLCNMAYFSNTPEASFGYIVVSSILVLVTSHQVHK